MGYLAHPTPAQHLDPTADINDWAYTETPPPIEYPRTLTYGRSLTRSPKDTLLEPVIALEAATDRAADQKARNCASFGNFAFSLPRANHDDLERILQPKPERQYVTAKRKRILAKIERLYRLVDQGFSNEEIAANLNVPLALVMHHAAGHRWAADLNNAARRTTPPKDHSVR